MAQTENGKQKIEQILLDMLANSLFNAGKPIGNADVNRSLVWYESYVQAVSLTAFVGGTPAGCDEKVLASIRRKLNDALRSAVNVNKEHIRLHKIMTEANIPYVILKGLASAQYYPDPLMRSMGDVDFLIKSEYLDEACKVLEQNGFERYPKEHEKHIVYFDATGHYEMHTIPAGVPDGENGEKIKSMLENIIDDSREVQTDFGTVRVPSHFHHGLVMLLHICSHLAVEGIGLRHLCDWAVFVSHFSESTFKSLFEEKLKSVGLWRLAVVLTQVCIKYLGCPPCDWVGEEQTDSVDGMMADIFKNGNLGQKNPSSLQERLFVNADSTKKSFIKHLFRSVNSIVCFYWKSARKFKVLLPFGWLWFGGRYIIRSIFGKRPKINLKTVRTRANERTDLYEDIKLFKPEQ